MTTRAPTSSMPDLAAEWKPSVNPWLITVAVMLGTFMEVLDTSVANVALEHIAGNLSATTEEATWVLTSYLVSNAIVLPATGWISRNFGRKRFLLTCIVIFTLASLACGMSTSLGMLIVARVVQGAGGGALQPIAQAILLESFPPEKRGKAMAAYAFGIIFAPIIGPTVGGWITDNYSWRWVFYINIPVGILAVFMIQAFVEDPPHIVKAIRSRLDYVGLGLLVIWLAAFQVMADQGQILDWFASPTIRYLAAIATVGFLAFVIWELYVDEPLVNLRVLKNRSFATGTFLVFMVGIVLYATTALLPLFLQTLMGYPALQSGLALSPRGIGSMAAILLIGRFVGRIDHRILIAAALLLLAYSCYLFGEITTDIQPTSVLWPVILSGAAVSMLFIPLTTAATGNLPTEQIGNATGIYNLLRNIGGAVGISMVTTHLSRVAQVQQANMVGHLNPYDPQYQQRLEQITHALARHTDAVTASQQAHQVLYNILLQQATLWAYIANFRMLALFCLACIPFVLLLRKPHVKGGPVEVHG